MTKISSLLAPVKRRRLGVFALLAAAFFFRLWYGTCSEFWRADEKQIFLIGLKSYTTRTWPWFGPDVGPTPIQMPGALQGLMVALPFFVAPVPEAPFVLLNLLSFASLCFLAWYCRRRVPEVPGWLVWTWLLTAPFTMNISTRLYNPAYVLTGAVLFFIGWLEILPQTSRKLIPARWANFMMGLALCWVMQFHLSWVVLVPFVLAALWIQIRQQGLGKALRLAAWFAGGALLTGAFLFPTYWKFGLRGGTGDTQAAVVLRHVGGVKGVFSLLGAVLIRFLAFADLDLPRFMGETGEARLAFLREYVWLVPLFVFLTAVCGLQLLTQVVFWFRRRHAHQDWTAIKYLTLASVCLLSVMFLFSARPPYAHTFYVFLPLVMIYSLYCWSEYLTRRNWQVFAAICLAAGIVFHVGLGLYNRAHHSMYVNRSIPLMALEKKDYHLMGERSPGARY